MGYSSPIRSPGMAPGRPIRPEAPLPRPARRLWLAGSLAIVAAFVFLAPPINQDQSYHLFADQTAWRGIPNFWLTVSNLPFLAAGVWGLLKLRRLSGFILSAGIFLTAFGSAYYHWAPSDATLVWDRLPMTFAFMALTALIVEVIEPEQTPAQGAMVLALFLAFGVGSVVWWAATEDLRLYAVAQFGPALLIVPGLWLRARIRALSPALLFYAAAKLCEAFDLRLYAWIPGGGHTLKHLLAAAAAYYLLRWTVEQEAVMPSKSASASTP